jgi:rsbT co-antagonist protein RsbR
MDAARDADMLRKFLASSPELLFFLDAQGNILGVSEPLQRLLGEGARPGVSLAAQLPAEARGTLEGALAALAAGEREAHGTCVLPAEGGADVFAITARRAEESCNVAGSLRAAAPALDREMRELIEEGRILRGLYRNLTMVVWAAERSGNIIFAEGKGLESAGVAPGQLLGRSFAEAFSASSDATSFKRAIAGEVAHSVSEAFGRAWENWYIPLRGDAGEVTFVAGLALDLSEVRRAERDLRARIELVERQQQVIRAMSTPIIEVWDKVLTLPMVGVVDSVRAAEVMDNLLQQVARKSARFAILDLTGVDTVDTSTASHLLKLIQALRLLGAEGIITGIQPDVAQTMVALGMNLETIVTLANLRDGLRRCMKRMQIEAKAAEAQAATVAANASGAGAPAGASGGAPAPVAY